MKVIQTEAVVTADHVLHVPVPDDMPEGTVEVVVIVQPSKAVPSAEERWAAAEAGRGALKKFGGSVEEFLRERRDDDRRRDKALGL